MKKLAAIAVALAAACGGGGKKAETTAKKVDTNATTTTTTETASTGGATEATQAEKKPAEPDTGGYHLNKLDAATFQPIDPSGQGPSLAVLHGDPKTGGAFLLKLPAGSKPGLHTHTSDYSAVVISGAPKHWLPGGEAKAKVMAPGSFWFQPGGQPHGDECTGKEPCVIYLVMPNAFDFAPAPNAKAGDKGKYTLTARKDVKFAPVDPSKPDGMKIAVLSGDPKTGPVTFMLEVPPGANAGLHSHTSDYHAITLDGAPAHWLPGDKTEGEPVPAFTYWFQPGGYDHGDRCTSKEPCHVIVHMEKALDFKPAASK